MEIDIRGKVNDFEIKKIIFSDYSDFNCYNLEKGSERVTIESGTDYIYIQDKESAENLIKALQKAIELNWWK